MTTWCYCLDTPKPNESWTFLPDAECACGIPNITDDRDPQKVAEAHLDACFEAMDNDWWDVDDDEQPDVLAPFCGCTTCVVREVLHAAFPIFQSWFRESIDTADTEVRALLQREFDPRPTPRKKD